MKWLSGCALKKNSLRPSYHGGSLPLHATINNCITYRFHKQYRQRFTLYHVIKLHFDTKHKLRQFDIVDVQKRRNNTSISKNTISYSFKKAQKWRGKKRTLEIARELTSTSLLITQLSTVLLVISHVWMKLARWNTRFTVYALSFPLPSFSLVGSFIWFSAIFVSQ